MPPQDSPLLKKYGVQPQATGDSPLLKKYGVTMQSDFGVTPNYEEAPPPAKPTNPAYLFNSPANVALRPVSTLGMEPGQATQSPTGSSALANPEDLKTLYAANAQDWAALREAEDPGGVMRKHERMKWEIAHAGDEILRQTVEKYRSEHPVRAWLGDLGLSITGAAGIPEQNIGDVAQQFAKGHYVEGFRRSMRDAVGTLPFVPNRKVGDDEATARLLQENAQLRGEAASEHWITRGLPQAAGALGGLGLALRGPGSLLKQAGEGVAEQLASRGWKYLPSILEGAKDATTGERAMGLLPGMTNLGLYTGQQDLENYPLARENPAEYAKKAGKSFLGGAALELGLRAVGRQTENVLEPLVASGRVSTEQAAKALRVLDPAAKGTALAVATTPEGESKTKAAVLNALSFLAMNSVPSLKSFLPGARASRELVREGRTLAEMRATVRPDEVQKALPAPGQGVARQNIEPTDSDLIGLFQQATDPKQIASLRAKLQERGLREPSEPIADVRGQLEGRPQLPAPGQTGPAMLPPRTEKGFEQFRDEWLKPEVLKALPPPQAKALPRQFDELWKQTQSKDPVVREAAWDRLRKGPITKGDATEDKFVEMFSGIPISKQQIEGGSELLGKLAGSSADKSPVERLLAASIATEKARRKNYGDLWFTPQHTNLKDSAPDVFEAATKSAAAANAAHSLGEYFGSKMDKILKEPWQHELFMRWMYGNQAQGMATQGKKPQPFMFLNPVDRALFEKHRAVFDPAIEEYNRQKAILDRLGPPEEAGLGPTQRRPLPENTPYMRMSRVSKESKPRIELLAKRERTQRRTTLLTGEDFGGESEGFGLGTRGLLSVRGNVRKMGSAKAASGQGDAYSLDYADVMKDMIADRLFSTTHNRLRETVKKYGIEVPEGGERPKTMKFNGKDEPADPVDIGVTPVWARRLYEMPEDQAAADAQPHESKFIYVPRSIAKAWNQHLVPPDAVRLPGVLGKATNLSTEIVLAQGGEATRHATNILGALATMPGIAKTPWEKLISVTGVGRIVPAVRRAMEAGDANYERDLISGIENGAIRGNHFGEYGTWMDAIPLMGQLKKSVFGEGGLEARTRVAMYRAIRQNDPTLGETEAWNAVNNELGTYVSALAPKVANVAAGTSLDPFARAGVGLGKNALKTLAGVDPSRPGKWFGGKFSAERATIIPSAIVTWMLLDKALDPSNRWFFQSGRKFGTLPINGQEIPFLDVFLNPVHRATSLLGLRGMADSVAHGQTTLGDLSGAAMRGSANSIIGRAGPIPRALTVAASSLVGQGQGNLPLMEGPPVGKPNPEHPILQTLKNVASTLVPQVGEHLPGAGTPEAEAEPLRTKVIRGVGDFFGFPTRAIQQDKQRIANDQKASEAIGYDVIDSIIRETRAEPPGRRVMQAMLLLKDRVPKEDYLRLSKILVQRVKSAPKSTEKAFQRAQR